MTGLSCFKAYDVRGRVPEDLNAGLAYAIGRAYAEFIKPIGPIAIGRDMRHSSSELTASLASGLNDAGIDTLDLGLCGTEMTYFAAGISGMGGAVMVTASHNPADYNGMKFVREKAIPISGDTGLYDIEALARSRQWAPVALRLGEHRLVDMTQDYVHKILSLVNIDLLRSLRIVVNAGNGCAGPTLDAIAEHLPFEIIRINHEPDGDFPNGIPNPLLPENRAVTAAAVAEHGADFGVAWDGDFDRCFLFDENGRFIEGYYIVGLIAERMLARAPGSKVIHDPRLTWNTIDLVNHAGGVPVQSKTGHAFIKERMRLEDAVYGGEMSAHHYFRDFHYCDSGMIPWLLVAELVSISGKSLSGLVDARIGAYPCSGEINFRVSDVPGTLERVLNAYGENATAIDYTDGVSVEFPDWRFNVRGSNTEPVLRLNVESRGDREHMKCRTEEISKMLESE